LNVNGGITTTTVTTTTIIITTITIINKYAREWTQY
jgi:hypothetical protein